MLEALRGLRRLWRLVGRTVTIVDGRREGDCDDDYGLGLPVEDRAYTSWRHWEGYSEES